jgi:hypothetical protein
MEMIECIFLILLLYSWTYKTSTLRLFLDLSSNENELLLDIFGDSRSNSVISLMTNQLLLGSLVSTKSREREQIKATFFENLTTKFIHLCASLCVCFFD